MLISMACSICPQYLKSVSGGPAVLLAEVALTPPAPLFPSPLPVLALACGSKHFS